MNVITNTVIIDYRRQQCVLTSSLMSLMYQMNVINLNLNTFRKVSFKHINNYVI